MGHLKILGVLDFPLKKIHNRNSDDRWHLLWSFANRAEAFVIHSIKTLHFGTCPNCDILNKNSKQKRFQTV